MRVRMYVCVWMHACVCLCACVHLSVRPLACLCVCMHGPPVCFAVCLSVSVCIVSVWPSLSPYSVCLVCLCLLPRLLFMFLSLSISSFCMHLCLHIGLSVSVCLSVCLVCLPCLFYLRDHKNVCLYFPCLPFAVLPFLSRARFASTRSLPWIQRREQSPRWITRDTP